MYVTVLIDNNSRSGLLNEWGLSFYIEYGGHKYLLDTGGSARFLENARSLGIDIASVDKAILSHAHFDHSLGMEPFFKANDKACFYVSPNCAENCYSGRLFIQRYIGLPKGVLDCYADRFVRPFGVTRLDDGVWIVPHSAPCDRMVARKSHLYVRKGWRFVPDDFSHEQSLVFETGSGLAVFNSCSHSGPEVVIQEVLAAFPGRTVRAYFGGLHLFRLKTSDVKSVAERLRSCSVPEIYTGHCTGSAAMTILKEYLGEGVCEMYSGLKVVIN